MKGITENIKAAIAVDSSDALKNIADKLATPQAERDLKAYVREHDMKINKCLCKKPMPYDNGQCEKCGKETGRGLRCAKIHSEGANK